MCIKRVLKNLDSIKKRKYFLNRQIEDNSISAPNINKNLITGYKGCYNLFIKRFLDLLISIIVVICFLPLFIITSAAVLIDSGLPIFYHAERGGYKNNSFKIFKFRSMIKDADKLGGGTTALDDTRITRIGRILRKYKIDELPNFINVLKGEMSIIGPRPELLRYTNKYIGTEKYIFKVKPGITDYSSLKFISLDGIVGNKDADKQYENYVLPIKNKLRIKYAANVSLLTDIKIFLFTLINIMKKITNN